MFDLEIKKFKALKERMLLDDETAIMTKEVAAQVDRYDHSYPTGLYPHKIWKRACVEGDFMCEVLENPEPGKVTLKWREMMVI